MIRFMFLHPYSIYRSSQTFWLPLLLFYEDELTGPSDKRKLVGAVSLSFFFHEGRNFISFQRLLPKFKSLCTSVSF